MVDDILIPLGVGGVLLAIQVGSASAEDPGDGPETVEFVVTSLDSDTGVDYSIHVENEPVRLTEPDVEDRLSAEPDDSITEQTDGTWVIRGSTGTASGEPPAYGDAFQWDTTSADLGILGWDASLPATEYTVTVNGEEADVSAFPAFDPPGAGGGDPPPDDGGDVGPGVVGGGEGYENTVDASRGDYFASTTSELSGALAAAGSGEIVFVDGDMNVGTQTFTVPSGVTLASDRGVGGSRGARLATTNSGGFHTIELEGGARLTGLRVHGTKIGVTVTAQNGIGGHEVGVRVFGSDAEIDNCDIGGYAERAIQVEGGAGNAHIHHSYIHDAPRQGLGYGVACADSALIEYNYFNNNRHSVTTANDTPGYTARFNHFGQKHVMHIIDAHDVFQGNCVWTDNIIENHEPRTWDDNANWGCGGYRGGVSGSIRIEDNWFWSGERDYLRVSGVSAAGNVYGTAGAHDPADIIPGHGGLASRPWHNNPVDWVGRGQLRFR